MIRDQGSGKGGVHLDPLPIYYCYESGRPSPHWAIKNLQHKPHQYNLEQLECRKKKNENWGIGRWVEVNG